MIGMVLVTHGRLADEFIAALEHVVGQQASIGTICIGPDDDIEQRRVQILEQVAEADQGEGAAVNFPKGGSAERQATSRREMATSRHRPVKISRSSFTHWG